MLIHVRNKSRFDRLLKIIALKLTLLIVNKNIPMLLPGRKLLSQKRGERRGKDPKLTRISPIDLEHLGQAHSPLQLSIDHSKSFETTPLPNPPLLLIARNTFTPLIDARKTEHSIFQRESGHRGNRDERDDTRVLKGVVREGGRGSKGEARAEIVPR